MGQLDRRLGHGLQPGREERSGHRLREAERTRGALTCSAPPDGATATRDAQRRRCHTDGQRGQRKDWNQWERNRGPGFSRQHLSSEPWGHSGGWGAALSPPQAPRQARMSLVAMPQVLKAWCDAAVEAHAAPSPSAASPSCLRMPPSHAAILLGQRQWGQVWGPSARMHEGMCASHRRWPPLSLLARKARVLLLPKGAGMGLTRVLLGHLGAEGRPWDGAFLPHNMTIHRQKVAFQRLCPASPATVTNPRGPPASCPLGCCSGLLQTSWGCTRAPSPRCPQPRSCSSHSWSSGQVLAAPSQLFPPCGAATKVEEE